VLMLFFVFLIPIPALFVLGYWFVLQFLSGVGELGARAAGGGGLLGAHRRVLDRRAGRAGGEEEVRKPIAHGML